jgi:putative GTP pyrophosphokinase
MTDAPATSDPLKSSNELDEVLGAFDVQRHSLGIFMEGVAQTIGNHPQLSLSGSKIVHSYKSRLKDREHLRRKVERKNADGRNITVSNLFFKITDLAGVRILHLYQTDFSFIHDVIIGKVRDGDWILDERPKAYTWDPEAVSFFSKFDLEVIEKASSYTSVHYLVRPRKESPLCCEIQVRTLFEEIWGEVDHQINYPSATDNLACREQLMVLSKIVGAGSRLLDSLQRVHKA